MKCKTKFGTMRFAALNKLDFDSNGRKNNEHIKTLIEFPPVQKAATFDFSELMKTLMKGEQ